LHGWQIDGAQAIVFHQHTLPIGQADDRGAECRRFLGRMQRIETNGEKTPGLIV
jgi:hypothetical protein